MTTLIQDVKPIFFAKLGYLLWQYRMLPGLRRLTRFYIKLVRKSTRWWFQTGSLMIMTGVMLYFTFLFSFALIQNQNLRQGGTLKLAELNAAMQYLGPEHHFQLALAQKALLDHINIANMYQGRFPMLRRLGIDAQKKQVCPYSKALRLSIKKNFIMPVLLQQPTDHDLIRFSEIWYQSLNLTEIEKIDLDIEDLHALLVYYFNFNCI